MGWKGYRVYIIAKWSLGVDLKTACFVDKIPRGHGEIRGLIKRTDQFIVKAYPRPCRAGIVWMDRKHTLCIYQ